MFNRFMILAYVCLFIGVVLGMAYIDQTRQADAAEKAYITALDQHNPQADTLADDWHAASRKQVILLVGAGGFGIGTLVLWGKGSRNTNAPS